MMTNNSPTVQAMISGIRPGSGNIPYGSAQMPTQFQSPYPSPMEMVKEIGYNQYMNPPQPMMGFPGVQNVNGVPMEAPNSNITVTYREIPGAPVNPGLAGMEGVTQVKPGRAIQVQSDIPYYNQTLTGMYQNQNRFVGMGPAFNPYGMPSMPTPPVLQQYQQQPQHPDIMGAVTIYNGQPIHPHSNMGWYGSVDFPLDNQAGRAMANVSSQSTMRDKFAQRFPGYSNPFAPPGFMQTPQQPAITPEIQDLANIAAFYGMTYDEFINNSAKAFKSMSRAVNRAIGTDPEKIQKISHRYDVKYPLQPGKVPDNDTDFFYPSDAFNYVTKNFTRLYEERYCTTESTKAEIKKMKVSITINGEIHQGSSRKISYSESRNFLDDVIRSDYNYRSWLAGNEVRMSQMYWSAPERQLDHVQGNVFDVTATAIAEAKQKDLERQLQYQRATTTSNLFYHDDYVATLRGIRLRNKQRRHEIQEKKFMDFVRNIPDYKPEDSLMPKADMSKIGIYDGDYCYALPGYDVMGIPIDKSPTRIIKMNNVTGEEELWDPENPKPYGLDIRERIRELVKNPKVSDMSEDELAKRLDIFNNDEFRDF